ncbi:MAG: hypothetical protein NZ842_01330 [Dehalococcoidia bacterium]|jgi:hypothetical protein|nr:hypothetical protein [Dehalococcoidia bacterium]
MKIPKHLRKPLLEQLSDQADSDDYLVMRGSALGHGLLGDDSKRDEFIERSLETPEPDLEGNELARELQSRALGMIVLGKDGDALLNQAKEIFETQLEKALPDIPDDIEIDIATEPLKMARQARSGLMENAFLRKEWNECVREAEHGRSIIPDYLLYQPHRKGYPIEFVAKGMLSDDKELMSQGVEMQEEFLQYVIEVGYLKPWEELYFVSYMISVLSRILCED